jgi:adenylyl cyclase-associated protein
MDSKLASLIERLEKVTTKLEGLQGGSAPAVQEPGVVTPSLTAFDDIIQGPVKEFLDLSRKTGGLVLDQALCFEKAIQATRQLIATASVSKKPDDKTLQELIKPLQTEMMNITAIKDKNRPAPVFSQLSAVADGSPALGWVVVSPTPGPYINDMKDAAQFYANRVIKENKEKDPSQLVWIQAFLTVLTELFGYVKKYHTTGLSWNAKGGDAKSAPAASAPVATPAPSAGGPPPPPAPTAAQLEAFSGDKKPAAANLLGELSKGTSGLRKVDKSEMTHKNPELRAGSVVKAVEKPVAVPKATATKGPPKLALEGNKWVVENHVGNNEVVIDGVELRHVVYIYNCHNSTIKINGKVNAVTIGTLI